VQQVGRSASDELADLLTEAVVNGELKPGQRLIEADLAARFNVSRGPVRSALTALERLGLAETLPRRGMVVVDLTAADVRDLYDVRIALERAAVERLASLSDVDWSALRSSVIELEDADRSGNKAASTQSSLGFHHALCALAGNKRLLRVWEQHSELIKLAIWMRQSAGRTTTADPRLHAHTELLDALAARDSERAVALIVSHLEATRDDLMRILDASPPEPGS
jgi:DNA-binding GntR family transcriptional regulator